MVGTNTGDAFQMQATTAFSLQVADVHGLVYSGQCVFVVLPGAMGELGILAHHAPLLSILQAGEMRMQLPDGSTEVLFLEGGFAEVQSAGVTVLADLSLRIPDLDPAAIKENIANAKNILAQGKQSEMNFLAAELELQRELAKYRAYQKYSSVPASEKPEYDWHRPAVPQAPKINPSALED